MGMNDTAALRAAAQGSSTSIENDERRCGGLLQPDDACGAAPSCGGSCSRPASRRSSLSAPSAASGARSDGDDLDGSAAEARARRRRRRISEPRARAASGDARGSLRAMLS